MFMWWFHQTAPSGGWLARLPSEWDGLRFQASLSLRDPCAAFIQGIRSGCGVVPHVGVRIGLCPIKATRGMDCSSSGGPFLALACSTCKGDQAQHVPFEACTVPLMDAVLVDLDCAEGRTIQKGAGR